MQNYFAATAAGRVGFGFVLTWVLGEIDRGKWKCQRV